MSKVVLLDAGPLGMIAHPRPNREIANWLRKLLQDGMVVVVPEIADYEVRRELLRARKAKSVARLDSLKSTLTYLPISTDAMLVAAEFWAEARQSGKPTADEKGLDADVILAAQAKTLEASADDIVVATANIGHLAKFVRAKKWDEIG